MPLECHDNISQRSCRVRASEPKRTPPTKLKTTVVSCQSVPPQSSVSSLPSSVSTFVSPNQTIIEPPRTAIATSSSSSSTGVTTTPPRPPRSTTTVGRRSSSSHRHPCGPTSQRPTAAQPMQTLTPATTLPVVTTTASTFSSTTSAMMMNHVVPTVRVVVRIQSPCRTGTPQANRPAAASTTPPAVVALAPTQGCFGNVSTRTALMTPTAATTKAPRSSTTLEDTSVSSNRTRESRTSTTLENDTNSCVSSLASRSTQHSGFSLLWRRKRRAHPTTTKSGSAGISTTGTATATTTNGVHTTATSSKPRSNNNIIVPASDASIASQNVPRLRPFFGRARTAKNSTGAPHTPLPPIENQAISSQHKQQTSNNTGTLSRCVHEWDAVYGPAVPFSQFYAHVMSSFTVNAATTIDRTPSNVSSSPSSLLSSLQQGTNTTVLLYGAAADRNASESRLGSANTPKSTTMPIPSHRRVVEPTASDDFFAHVLDDLFPMDELDVPRENFDPTMAAVMDPDKCHPFVVVVQLSVVELLPTRRVRDLLKEAATTTADPNEDASIVDDSMSLLSGSGSDVATKSHTVQQCHPTTMVHRPPYRGTITRTTLTSRDHGRHVLRQSMIRRRRHYQTPLQESQSSSCASHVVYTFTVTTTNTIALQGCRGGSHNVDPIARTTPTTTTTTANLTLVDLGGVGVHPSPSFHSPSASRGTNDAMTQSHDMVVLGQVLTALLHKKSFVPFYDDSALTKILREALGTTCRVTLVACVSPDSTCINDTVATLHYAEHIRSIPPVAAVLATPPKKKNDVLFDPHGMLTTPLQRTRALQAENMILQARIANLTRRQNGSTDDTTNLDESVLVDRSHRFCNLPTRRGGTGSSNNVMDMASLEAKVFRARQERQVTKDRCETVTAATERLRLKCQAASMKAPLSRFNKEQSTNTKASLKQNISALVYEKVELCDELVAIVTSIERNHNNETAMTIVQTQVQRLANLLRDNENRLQHIITTSSGLPQHDGQHKAGADIHQRELQERISTLTHSVDAANHENETLRLQNKQLVSEIQRLRITTGKFKSSTGSNLGCTVDYLGDELDGLSGVPDENDRLTPEHRNIRSHAALLLDWADRAIQKTRNTPTNDFGEGGSSTIASSSLGTDLRPSSCVYRNASQTKNTIDNENQFLFGNVDGVHNAMAFSCPCQDSVLTSSPPHIEFYLPKLGIMCCCGRKQEVYLNDPDPSHLVNILRDWQVDFLESLGIRTAADLVHAYSSNKFAVKRLAQSMRLWRKEQAMLSVKTKSCGIALRIWSRTCHAVLTALQDTAGGRSETGRPDFLDVSFSSATVSSLGFGNSVSDLNLSRDDAFGIF